MKMMDMICTGRWTLGLLTEDLNSLVSAANYLSGLLPALYLGDQGLHAFTDNSFVYMYQWSDTEGLRII